jgi:hypothetical protein
MTMKRVALDWTCIAWIRLDRVPYQRCPGGFLPIVYGHSQKNIGKTPILAQLFFEIANLAQKKPVKFEILRCFAFFNNDFELYIVPFKYVIEFIESYLELSVLFILIKIEGVIGVCPKWP